jgi:hypothetical protein
LHGQAPATCRQQRARVAAVECLVGIGRLSSSLRALLALPDRLSSELRDVERALRGMEKSVAQTSKRHDGDLESLRAEVNAPWPLASRASTTRGTCGL